MVKVTAGLMCPPDTPADRYTPKAIPIAKPTFTVKKLPRLGSFGWIP
jgi:hypothetical protein